MYQRRFFFEGNTSAAAAATVDPAVARHTAEAFPGTVQYVKQDYAAEFE